MPPNELGLMRLNIFPFYLTRMIGSRFIRRPRYVRSISALTAPSKARNNIPNILRRHVKSTRPEGLLAFLQSQILQRLGHVCCNFDRFHPNSCRRRGTVCNRIQGMRLAGMIRMRVAQRKYVIHRGIRDHIGVHNNPCGRGVAIRETCRRSPGLLCAVEPEFGPRHIEWHISICHTRRRCGPASNPAWLSVPMSRHASHPLHPKIRTNAHHACARRFATVSPRRLASAAYHTSPIS